MTSLNRVSRDCDCDFDAATFNNATLETVTSEIVISL